MPLYEYVCRSCAHEFEALVSGGVTPPCPRCDDAGARRVMSVVSIGRNAEATAAPAPGPCGSCGDPRGPGSCALD